MSHLHADVEWYNQQRELRDLARSLPRPVFEFWAPPQAPVRRALPRRSRWQRVRDEIARWMR